MVFTMKNYEHVDFEATKKEFDEWAKENIAAGAMNLLPDTRQLMLQAFREGYESGYDAGMWDHISG